MRRLEGKLIFFVLLLFTVACGRNSQSRPSGDPDIIQRYQIQSASYASAHDVVRALRPNWLIKRSPNGRNSPTPIWVYVDGNRFGDISQLRNISAQSIGSIRRIDGISATTRWGTGHSEGVLYVLTYVPERSGNIEQ
jgi:hypothetical protein